MNREFPGPITENQMQKNMEKGLDTLGPRKAVHSDITTIMENQMEMNMETELETLGPLLTGDFKLRQ